MATASAKATSKRAPRTTKAGNIDATSRVGKNAKAANTKIANQLNDAAEDAGQRFADVTEDLQDRAQGVAGGAVSLTRNVIEFQRDNIEALVESGKLTAEGALLLTRSNLALTRENIVALSRALQGMASRGTPKQRVARQADYLRGGANRLLEQAAVNVVAVMEISGNVSEPISERFKAIRGKALKAA